MHQLVLRASNICFSLWTPFAALYRSLMYHIKTKIYICYLPLTMLSYVCGTLYVCDVAVCARNFRVFLKMDF